MQNTALSYYSSPYKNTLQPFGQTNAAPPSTILPMHGHAKPTLPHETQRRWNRLATLGVGTTILGALLLIGTRFKAVEKFFQSHISEKSWQKITQNNKKTIANRAWQIIGIGGLMQGVNRYETAANTSQPSKLAAALTGTVQAFGFLFSSHFILQAIGFVTAALLYAGEQNDIENSNHPDKRREWDLNRLHKPLQNRTVAQELAEAAGFVKDDFKNAFSTQHWKNLKKTLSATKKDWQTPQSYQSALGVQFSTISLGLTAMANALAKPLQSIFPLIQHAGSVTNVIGSLIPQMPVAMRAWQNKDQVDGQLVLLGAPLITAGRLFQMMPQTIFLGGLGFVGDAIKGKGLALNSQKYLALLNEMRSLQQIALNEPYITANSVLTIMTTSPDVLRRLKEQMGQQRLDFLLQLLKDADKDYQEKGTSLSAFLTPLLETNNHN